MKTTIDDIYAQYEALIICNKCGEIMEDITIHSNMYSRLVEIGNRRFLVCKKDKEYIELEA